MSYTITISGTAVADDATVQATEQAIVDTISAAVASLPTDAGLTSAFGSFDTLGSVDLAPVVTPPPAPGPSVDEARASLDTAVNALVAAEVAGTVTADEIDAVKTARDVLDKALTDSEQAPDVATADAAPDVFAL